MREVMSSPVPPATAAPFVPCSGVCAVGSVLIDVEVVLAALLFLCWRDSGVPCCRLHLCRRRMPSHRHAPLLVGCSLLQTAYKTGQLSLSRIPARLVAHSYGRFELARARLVVAACLFAVLPLMWSFVIPAHTRRLLLLPFGRCRLGCTSSGARGLGAEFVELLVSP